MRAVYMTGYAENASIYRDELDKGAQLIEKPFTTPELLTMIKGAMS